MLDKHASMYGHGSDPFIILHFRRSSRRLCWGKSGPDRALSQLDLLAGPPGTGRRRRDRFCSQPPRQPAGQSRQERVLGEGTMGRSRRARWTGPVCRDRRGGTRAARRVVSVSGPLEDRDGGGGTARPGPARPRCQRH